MDKVAVIGLGRFGMHLVKKLGPSRMQVIAVDRSQQLVNEIKDDVDVAIRLDSTDAIALESQNIHRVDVAAVTIGENFEAALLTTVILKKLQVPHVICRALTEFHAEIFRQIGADEVIQPESEAGETLARRLINPHLEDVMILSEGFALIELITPAVFCDQTLEQLQLRANYDVNLVAVKRPIILEQDGEKVTQQKIISVPKPNDVILEGDVLVLIGSDEALARLPKE